jgi:hypothetical protein
MSTLTTHLLQRIARDPRLAYYFDPLSRSMEMLTEVHAADYALDLKGFRETYYPQLKFEPPIRPDELLAVLNLALETIHAFHGDAGWDIYKTHSPEMQRISAAIAKAEGRQ